MAGLEPGQDGYGNEGDRAESGDQLSDEDESDENEITHAVPFKCTSAAHEKNYQHHLEQAIYHPRTQGLFGKDPGIVWSRDSTKINCPRGSGKVSNYMLENVTVNFKYQEWNFTIHRSKRSLTSILYFCLLLNYKSTVAFYQQSSQETNKSYTLKFEVGYSLTNIFSYQTGQSSTFVYFRFYLFLKYAIYRFVVCKR